MSAKDATLDESIEAICKSTGLAPEEVVKIARECNSTEELSQVFLQLIKSKKAPAASGN